MQNKNSTHAGKRKHSAMAVIAAAAVFSGALGITPVFAEGSAAPVVGVSGEQADVATPATVTVSGLKKGSTVKLYQIVDGYYKDGKLVKYVLMDPENGKIAAIGDSAKGQTKDSNDIITEAEITTIAANIRDKKFTADTGTDMTVGTEADADGKVSATASVEPGMYMVLATDPDGAMVYNPAIVAVNITDVNANKTEGGSVKMTDFFTAGSENVYVKSSESSDKAKKEITGSTKKAVLAERETAGAEMNPTISGGDTVAIGDTEHFKISGIRIPSYSVEYKNPSYVITDNLDSSFDKVDTSKVVVYVGGTEEANKVAPSSGDTKTYTIAAGTDSGFVITFDSAYLTSLRGKTDAERDIVVTYDAILGENATNNFAENHNRVDVKYSNDPKDSTQTHTVDKDTYTYTFGIGATALDSEATTSDQDKTKSVPSVIKAGADQVTTTNDKTTLKEAGKALAGATFTLYSDEACTKVSKTVLQPEGTAVSAADGSITFSGLDEGTYYMKETTAPAGYGLSGQTFKFVIAATLDNDGVLKSYTVTTSYKDATHSDWTGASTATFTAASYTKKDDGSIDYSAEAEGKTASTITGSAVGDAYIIVDTKLQNMPSTGGTGLMLIVALAAGAGAAGYALDKKRKAQAE